MDTSDASSSASNSQPTGSTFCSPNTSFDASYHGHALPPSHPTSASEPLNKQHLQATPSLRQDQSRTLLSSQDDTEKCALTPLPELSSEVVSKQRQAPINPYIRKGRGHGNPAALASRSGLPSQGGHRSGSSSTGNRFALLQDDNSNPAALTNATSSSPSPGGDRVQFAEDQALGQQLFGSG